ncbi:MAG: hypothetical protein AAFU85_10780 [Planctomycetota bacterium]
MLSLLLLGLFVFVTITTAKICAGKGHPLWIGLGLGVFGQLIARQLATFAVVILAALVPAAATTALLIPIVQILTPIFIAHWLPQSGKGRNVNAGRVLSESQHDDDGDFPCPYCGRIIAKTTTICPRCMKKPKDAVVAAPQRVVSDNPYEPPRQR